MYYQGGVLRFGKLTMKRTDLLIIDAGPSDAFDFFLDQYNAQLLAGYSKNTPNHGLIVVMQGRIANTSGRHGNIPTVRTVY